MIWNNLTYDHQCRVIDRIVDLLKEEENEQMVDGIMAAVHELQTWSNSPCPVIEANGQTVYDVEADPFCEKGWDT